MYCPGDAVREYPREHLVRKNGQIVPAGNSNVSPGEIAYYSIEIRDCDGGQGASNYFGYVPLDELLVSLPQYCVDQERVYASVDPAGIGKWESGGAGVYGVRNPKRSPISSPAAGYHLLSVKDDRYSLEDILFEEELRSFRQIPDAQRKEAIPRDNGHFLLQNRIYSKDCFVLREARHPEFRMDRDIRKVQTPADMHVSAGDVLGTGGSLFSQGHMVHLEVFAKDDNLIGLGFDKRNPGKNSVYYLARSHRDNENRAPDDNPGGGETVHFQLNTPLFMYDVIDKTLFPSPIKANTTLKVESRDETLGVFTCTVLREAHREVVIPIPATGDAGIKDTAITFLKNLTISEEYTRGGKKTASYPVLKNEYFTIQGAQYYAKPFVLHPLEQDTALPQGAQEYIKIIIEEKETREYYVPALNMPLTDNPRVEYGENGYTTKEAIEKSTVYSFDGVYKRMKQHRVPISIPRGCPLSRVYLTEGETPEQFTIPKTGTAYDLSLVPDGSQGLITVLLGDAGPQEQTPFYVHESTPGIRGPGCYCKASNTILINADLPRAYTNNPASIIKARSSIRVSETSRKALVEPIPEHRTKEISPKARFTLLERTEHMISDLETYRFINKSDIKSMEMRANAFFPEDEKAVYQFQPLNWDHFTVWDESKAGTAAVQNRDDGVCDFNGIIQQIYAARGKNQNPEGTPTYGEIRYALQEAPFYNSLSNIILKTKSEWHPNYSKLMEKRYERAIVGPIKSKEEWVKQLVDFLKYQQFADSVPQLRDDKTLTYFQPVRFVEQMKLIVPRVTAWNPYEDKGIIKPRLEGNALESVLNSPGFAPAYCAGSKYWKNKGSRDTVRYPDQFKDVVLKDHYWAEINIPANIPYLDGRIHLGVDFAGLAGTPIYSMIHGEVWACTWDASIENSTKGYGRVMVIKSRDEGKLYLLAHLSDYLLQPGDTVEPGQEVALVGNTGYSMGAHLHLEVRICEEKYSEKIMPKRPAANESWKNAENNPSNGLTWIIGKNPIRVNPFNHEEPIRRL